MSNLSEEKIREAISCIRVLYSVMYNFEDGLKDRMQGRIDYLEKFINSLLDQYNNLKSIEKEHQKLNGELREELNREKEKNKLIADDIKKFKVEAYILGKTEENETMKGVIKRHYISKDKIRELKKFYIKDCENKDITLVPLENLVKNINILLEEE